MSDLHPVAFQNDSRELFFAPESVTSLVESLLPLISNIPPGEIVVALVDADTSARLHDAFFADPAPTDVMTFPGNVEDGHAGDIVICAPVLLEAALEWSVRPEEEFSRYIIHGLLHLAGYRDSDPEEQERMKSEEDRALAHLRQNGKLPRLGTESR